MPRKSKGEFLVAGMRGLLASPKLDDAEAKELCAKAQCGDGAAMEQLCGSFAALAMALSSSFSKLCRGVPTIDPQDLFGIAMENGMRFGVMRYDVDGEVPFSNWVALCMRLRLTKAIDKEHRHNRLLAENLQRIAHEWYGEPSRGWSDRIESDEVLGDLRCLVQAAVEFGALSDAEGAALVLRCEGNMQNRVAEALGLHRNTVARYINKALQVVQAMLEVAEGQR